MYILVTCTFPLQVIWDPAVSLLVNLWPDQPVCDQRGCGPPVHRVRRRHHVRHLQHHFSGGAPQHAHRHDEQLLPAHRCEHRNEHTANAKATCLGARNGWCITYEFLFLCPDLDSRITQTSSGSSPGQSCGWATLKKGAPCRPRSTSSPAPNHSGTSCVGLRGKCARGQTPSATKPLELSE